MKHRLVLPAVVALAVLASACSSDSKAATTSVAAATASSAPVTAAPTTVAPAPATDAPATTAPATADLPMSAAINIAQFKFVPADIHLAVGGTVTWTNSDNQKHTATASGSFDTGAIESGGMTASATFDTAGTFAYICAFHPFMKGTVVVGS